jgi:hypothetical protein
MGSGGSAFSALLFVVGLAAGFAAGGGAAVVAPAFGAVGAGVLPSTGSAIIPVINLSDRNYKSR